MSVNNRARLLARLVVLVLCKYASKPIHCGYCCTTCGWRAGWAARRPAHGAVFPTRLILRELSPSMVMQGGGVFCSPRSAEHKPKLRLLYECAPLAMVVEAAGGAAIGADGPILDQTFRALDETCVVALGERQAVAECRDALCLAA